MKYQILAFATLALSLIALAGHGDEGHDHGSSSAAAEQKTESDMHHEDHGHSDEAAHHQHAKWIEPPADYAGMVSDKWADPDAIARGEEIYNEQCVSCHGADGQGAGPMAQALSHPPADLTNNFHTAPGSGDAYLFWRVSEGGTVEPFKSQNSAMPAFKNVLSRSERWDVLAYVHTFFHQGLAEWNNSSSAQSAEKTANDGS